MPEHSPREEQIIAQHTASRIQNDAKLIQGGARYVTEESAEHPRLEVTSQQIANAKNRMRREEELRQKDLPGLMRYFLKRHRADIVYGDQDLADLEQKIQLALQRYSVDFQNRGSSIPLICTIVNNWARDKMRRQLRELRGTTRQQKKSKREDDLFVEEMRRSQEQILETDVLARAEKEFWPTTRRLIDSGATRVRQLKMFEVLYDGLFKATDYNTDDSKKFLNRSRNWCDQNYHRAIGHLLDFSETPETLRKALLWAKANQYRKTRARL